MTTCSEELRKQLFEAAKRGDEANVSLLVERGCDVAWKEPSTRETAVHVAARWGRLAALFELLSRGGDPCSRNERGRTPVHDASRTCNPACVHLLAAAAAKCLPKNRASCAEGQLFLTPIAIPESVHTKAHLVATRTPGGTRPLAAGCIEAGLAAVPEPARSSQGTAAMPSGAGGSSTVQMGTAALQQLLDNGCPAHHAPVEAVGSSPAHCSSDGSRDTGAGGAGEGSAAQKGAAALGASAQEHEAAGQASSSSETLPAHAEEVCARVRMQPLLDATDTDGLSALHFAVRVNCIDTVELLLSLGASPDVTDRDRKTPLHFAAARCHIPCIKLLLSAGAVVSAVDASGNTPLHCASVSGILEGVQLLSAGAGDTAAMRNRRGATPHDLAVEHGNTEAASHLALVVASQQVNA